MKKVLLIALAVVVFALPAFASWTSSASTGGIPAVLCTTDDQIVQTYPSLMPGFANQALVEYGYNGLWGYMMIDTGMGVVGISSSPTLSMNYDLSPAGFLWSVDNVVGLQYAIGLEGMTIGGALAYGNSAEETQNLDPDSDQDGLDPTFDAESYIGATIGASLDVGFALDLALNFQMWNEKDMWTDNYDTDDDASDDIAEQDIEDNTQINLGISGRAMVADLIANLSVNVGIASSTDSNLQNDVNGDATNDTTETINDMSLSISALLGKEIKATDSLTLNIGTGVNVTMNNTEKETYTDGLDGDNDYTDYQSYNYDVTEIMVPLYVAAEGKLNETWTIRGGITVDVLDIYNQTYTDYDTVANDAEVLDKDTNTTTTTSNGIVDYAIGVTGVIGDLTLDMMLNPWILISGPDFISGNGPGNIASQVAVSYKWGN